MPASGPVTRSTLRQQIADALRDEVLAGRLQPGKEFTVKQIAEQYGVSATPVREALVDLSAQGLLDSDQHKGFRVHQFTVGDYRGMVEARALVVDGVLRRDPRHAAHRGGARAATAGAATAAATPPGAVPATPAAAGAGTTVPAPSGTAAASAPAPSPGAATRSCLPAEALGPVRRRAEAAARAARAGDLDILIGYDVRFWRELGGLVANHYIADFLHRLRVQAWVFAVPHLRADPRPGDWLWSGHEELVDAVATGAPARVGAVLDAYNAHALRWADHLERLPAPRPAPPA
ncbi:MULTISPECIES: GntR family transcriptional regulator [Streptomyces]|uniref:GntR family transcriptional regulator n=2 Tax=Streptomyces TaxID=1883 RepID=A0A100Y8W9_9ACTN|nr:MULTISPECIES: GntR family transcriptional regulator [Streptomyces]KUH39839.1 GntR family transcriptional regulator [Streptomyces kanasensis]UUS32189.1 GntR family transcriptional regulator [Streptomyces changanensis]